MKSVRFTTSRAPVSGADVPRECWHLHLRLNGKDVPYAAVAQGTNFIRWAADVASLAGKTSEIRFLLETGFPQVGPLRDVGVAIALDAISLSTEAAPPGVFAVQQTNGTFSVSVQTIQGVTYGLEYSDELTPTGVQRTLWSALPGVAGTGGVISLTDTNNSVTQRFYILRQW